MKWAALLVCIVAFGYAGCRTERRVGGFGGGGLRVHALSYTRTAEGLRVLAGVVENSGKRSYRAIGIDIRCFDAEGAQTGKMRARVEDLKPGEQKQFSIPLDDSTEGFCIGEIKEVD
jgi:hypothetical protein